MFSLTNSNVNKLPPFSANRTKSGSVDTVQSPLWAMPNTRLGVPKLLFCNDLKLFIGFILKNSLMIVRALLASLFSSVFTEATNGSFRPSALPIVYVLQKNFIFLLLQV